jgi:mitochondrial fission protein ELM1
MNPIVIWRITDGKAGHEAQSRGLVEALGRLRAVDCRDLPALPRLRAVAGWLAGRFPPGSDLPDPDLVVGAGHATHFSVLAARRARGGRSVVLMMPSLPLRLFDLCLVPEHDDPPESTRVAPTVGVLNPVRPAAKADRSRGLILIGGPSAHYDWNGPAMLEQVLRVVSASPGIRWTLTTSRRTPAGFAPELRPRSPANLEVVPCEETEPGWVARHLQACATAWVSEDSVSMVFEALTAGARVGLLPMPTRGRASRVRRAVETLVRTGRVVRLPVDGPVPEPPAQSEPLAEADRCARIVLERFGVRD